jgi:hypothetical protein
MRIWRLGGREQHLSFETLGDPARSRQDQRPRRREAVAESMHRHLNASVCRSRTLRPRDPLCRLRQVIGLKWGVQWNSKGKASWHYCGEL